MTAGSRVPKAFIVVGMVLLLFINVGCALVIEGANGQAGVIAEETPADTNVSTEGDSQAQEKDGAGKTKPSPETAAPSVLDPTVIPVTLTPLTPTGSATAVPPASVPTTATPAVWLYVVQPGDTLAKIAAKFNVSVQMIADFNHLPDPNNLVSGQLLSIPQGTVLATPVLTPVVTIFPTATPVPVVVVATATPVPVPTTPVPTSTPAVVGSPTQTTVPTPTATPQPTKTPIIVSLIGEVRQTNNITETKKCGSSNWVISANDGILYYLLMPDDLEVMFDPVTSSYPATVSGIRDNACDKKLVIVNTLTWLGTPTPSATPTVTPVKPTATKTPSAMTLVGEIIKAETVSCDPANPTNWIIKASDQTYYLLMPDKFTPPYEPFVPENGYPGMISGLESDACDGKLVIVNTITWLAPTPTTAVTSTPTSEIK